MQGYLKCLVCITAFIAIIPNSVGIKCFECQSALDPKCADLFDNSTVLITDCNRVKEFDFNLKPKVCRKTKQKVNGEWSYTRGCGSLSEDFNGNTCVQRTESDNIIIEHCMCNNKDGCNTSFTFGPTPMLFILPVFATLLLQ